MNVIKRLRGPVKQFFRSLPKVSFIVVGAQKGGTTALDHYLRQHAGICMPKKKELHYFDNEEYFNKPDYSIYHYYFSPKHSGQILGEVTPSYMFWQDAPRRIWEYNPDIKLIAILRNPIERAFSHWNMQYLRGKDTRSFWQAITQETETCRMSLPFQNRPFSYISRGFYSEQLRRLWLFFPQEQVLVLRNKELRQHPQQTLDRISTFLNIDPFPVIENKLVHTMQRKIIMTDKEKKYLHYTFEYEIKQLERMLDWDCSDWLE